MLALILQYKYFILLPLTIIEGPIVTMMAAFLASMGTLNIYWVYIVAVLGDLIGDSIYYWIGRSGRNTIIPKYSKYVGITEEKILFAEQHYENHLWKTIIFGKIVQAPILIILVVAGITKTDFKKFLLVILTITIPKVFLFVLLGFYLGKSYSAVGHGLDVSMVVVWIILIIGFIAYKMLKTSKTK